MKDEKLINIDSFNPNKQKVSYKPRKMSCTYTLSFIWIGAMYISLYFSFKSKKAVYSVTFFFLYLFYQIMQIYIFCGKCMFFSKKIYRLEKKLDELFLQGPKIEIVVECYHIDSRNDNEGNTTSYDKITYRENINFDYYSWKDISGFFQVENEAKNNKKYPFIVLDIDVDVYFADSITIYDLNKLKDELIEKNKHRDKYIRVIVNKGISRLGTHKIIYIEPKGMSFILTFPLHLIPIVSECYNIYLEYYYHYYCQKFKIRKVISTRYNFVHIYTNDCDNCHGFNCFIYLFFGLFFPPLYECYKIYLDKQYDCQTFKIRKVISTRNNVKKDEKYNLISSGLNGRDGKIMYKNIGSINTNYELKEPTKEELDKSMEYNNLIPYFNINNIEEGIYIVSDINTPLNNNTHSPS